MAHNEIPVSTWLPTGPPGSTWITPGDPVRTELAVERTTIGFDSRTQQHWANDPILGGSPPIIVGWECNLQWEDTSDYEDWLWTCEPQAITVPTDVDGEPVVAVALYLGFIPEFERSLSGGGTGVEGPVEPCKSVSQHNAKSYGETEFNCFVDATQVAHIQTFEEDTGPWLPNNIDTAYFGHLIVPELVADVGVSPQWVIGREPFEPHNLYGTNPPVQVGGDHWLFWGPDVAGETFPEEVSFTLSHTNIRTVDSRSIGSHDPGPLLQPIKTIEGPIIAYVDVYPYVWYGGGDANLMMVV